MPRFPLVPLAWALLLAAVVGWAALLVLAPVLGQAAPGRPVRAVLAAGAYLAGGAVCHQRTDRSFHLGGAQLPVCGRCTGLYLSAAAGVLLVLGQRVTKRARGRETFRDHQGKRLPAPSRPWRTWLLAAAVPSLLTLAIEWSGGWPVSNAARAISAAPLGLVIGALLVESAGFRGRL